MSPISRKVSRQTVAALAVATSLLSVVVTDALTLSCQAEKARPAKAASNGGGGEGRSSSWRKADQGAPSLAKAQAAVEKNPQDASANNDLGWAYRQNNDPDKAEQYLREAIKLKADMPQAHSNLSVVLYDKGNFAEATNEATRAVELDGASPIYHVVLGNALSKSGQLKAAIEQYQAAIKLKPDYENALYNLGRVQLEAGNANDAKFTLSEALKYDPNDDRVLKLLEKIMPQ